MKTDADGCTGPRPDLRTCDSPLVPYQCDAMDSGMCPAVGAAVEAAACGDNRDNRRFGAGCDTSEAGVAKWKRRGWRRGVYSIGVGAEGRPVATLVGSRSEGRWHGRAHKGGISAA